MSKILKVAIRDLRKPPYLITEIIGSYFELKIMMFLCYKKMINFLKIMEIQNFVVFFKFF